VLPSRVPALFEAVISLDNAPDGVKAIVTSKKDLNIINFNVKLDNARAFKAKITPRRILNYTPEITVNGKKHTGMIPANANISVTYRSKNFGITYAQLENFPWLKSRIYLPANPNAAEKKAAEELKGYFDFLKLKVSGSEANIRICVRPDVKGMPITIKGKELFFKAKDAAEARALMRELNYAMDRKFPWFVKEPYGGAVMKKLFDFIKYPMPYVRCFEQEQVK
jgi:hypothetical protein